jgi:hypothetical protein
MTYHVSIDRFRVGERVYLLTPVQQERLQSALSTYFFSKSDVMEDFKSIEGPIRAGFSFEKGVALSLNGRVKSYEMDPKLRKVIDKIVQYAKHVGVAERSPLLGIDRTKAKCHSLAPRPKGAYKEAGLTIASSSIDAISMTRSIMRAQGFENNKIVIGGGFILGAAGLGYGLQQAFSSSNERTLAASIRDGEGVRRAQANYYNAGAIGGGSAFYLVGKGTELSASGAAANASVVLGNIAGTLFGIGTAIGIGLSLLGMYRCSGFRDRIDEYLNNPQYDESKRYEAAVRFLRDTLVVTAEEKASLIEEVKNENPQAESKVLQALIEERLKQLSEVKIKFTKRRSSMRAVHLILHRSDRIIEKMGRGEGLEEAKALINSVKKESWKKTIYFVVGLIAALVGIAGVIAGTFFTCGVLPFILYAVSSGIYILIALFGLVSSIARKGPDTPGAEIAPLSIEQSVAF